MHDWVAHWELILPLLLIAMIPVWIVVIASLLTGLAIKSFWKWINNNA